MDKLAQIILVSTGWLFKIYVPLQIKKKLKLFGLQICLKTKIDTDSNSTNNKIPTAIHESYTFG